MELSRIPWLVDVLPDKGLHVGWTINLREAALKHKLGDPSRRLDLDFEDVRLRRIEHAQSQLLGMSACARLLFRGAHTSLVHSCSNR
jgi:hypothetical protein